MLISCSMGSNFTQAIAMKTGHRIAVIDKDDALRELLHRWLAEAGHLVETHTHLAGVGDVDLVIAEVTSPRSGRPLLSELPKPVCAVAVLLTSARFRKGQERSVELADELGVKGVLPKPFTERELLAAVGQALSR